MTSPAKESIQIQLLKIEIRSLNQQLEANRTLIRNLTEERNRLKGEKELVDKFISIQHVG
jgi:hypothetical protein